MADKVVQGTRGTADYSANQRPTNYGGGIKLKGSRVSREDAAKMTKRVERGHAPKEIHQTIRAKDVGKKMKPRPPTAKEARIMESAKFSSHKKRGQIRR